MSKSSHNPGAIHWFGPFVLILLILGTVVNNQPWGQSFYSIGRIINLLSIAFASAIVLLGASRYRVAMWTLVISVFVAGAVKFASSVDFGYLYLQNGLFFLAGSWVGLHSPARLRWTLIVLAALSSVAMLLQVLGVGEWVFTLSTHGVMESGISISKTPVSTFLVPYRELQGNFLQGRPSGIFHSNQYTTLIAIAGLAFYFDVLQLRRSSWSIVLATFGILTLSKSLFLASVFMVAYSVYRSPELKRNVFSRCGQFAAAFVVYGTAFPGILGTYLGFAVTYNSLLVRVFDVFRLLHLPAGLRGTHSPLVKSGNFVLGDRAMHAVVETSVRTSGIGEMVEAWPLSVAVIGLLVIGYRIGVRTTGRPKAFSILLLIGLSCYLLSAAMTTAQSFWFLAGVALYPVGAVIWIVNPEGMEVSAGVS